MSINTYVKTIQNRAAYLLMNIKQSKDKTGSIRQLNQEDRRLIQSAIDVMKHPEKVKSKQIASERVDFIVKVFNGDALNGDQKDPLIGGVSVAGLAQEIDTLSKDQIKSATCGKAQRIKVKIENYQTQILNLKESTSPLKKIKQDKNDLKKKVEKYRELIAVLNTGNDKKIKKAIESVDGQSILLDLTSQSVSHSNNKQLKKALDKQVILINKQIMVKKNTLSPYKGKDIDSKVNNNIQKVEQDLQHQRMQLQGQLGKIATKTEEKQRVLNELKSSHQRLLQKEEDLKKIVKFCTDLQGQESFEKVAKSLKHEELFSHSPEFSDELKAINQNYAENASKKNGFELFKKHLEKRVVALQTQKNQTISALDERIRDLEITLYFLTSHAKEARVVLAVPSAPPVEIENNGLSFSTGAVFSPMYAAPIPYADGMNTGMYQLPLPINQATGFNFPVAPQASPFNPSAPPNDNTTLHTIVTLPTWTVHNVNGTSTNNYPPVVGLPPIVNQTSSPYYFPSTPGSNFNPHVFQAPMSNSLPSLLPQDLPTHVPTQSAPTGQYAPYQPQYNFALQPTFVPPSPAPFNLSGTGYNLPVETGQYTTDNQELADLMAQYGPKKTH